MSLPDTPTTDRNKDSNVLEASRATFHKLSGLILENLEKWRLKGMLGDNLPSDKAALQPQPLKTHSAVVLSVNLSMSLMEWFKTHFHRPRFNACWSTA